MKTSKFFLATLAVAGALTACVNDQAVEQNKQGNEISFRLQGGVPETKATATLVEHIDALAVWGGYRAEWENTGASPTLTFSKTTVFRDVEMGGVAFNYYPKKYYPIGVSGPFDMIFYAFSPVSALNGGVTPNFGTGAGDRYVTLAYNNPVPNITGNTTQVDLLAGYYIEGSHNPAASVNIKFYHALSRIFVAASNGTETPVVITGMTIKDVGSEAECTIDEVGLNSAKIKWDTPTATTSYPYILPQSGVAVPPGADKLNVVSMEQGMLIIPQIVGGAVGELSVNYTFANLGAQTATFQFPAGFNLAVNTQYRIIIDFDATAISFTVSVEPFTDPIIEVPAVPAP